MIVAIDGPAGAGKSTTARAVAARFGWAYVDTGAMYRAIALIAHENRVLESDENALADVAQTLPLQLEENGTRILLEERDVSALIRTREIGELTSKISALPRVREKMVELQRRIARESENSCGGAVLEGRDIQTVVFPDAEIKVFLTAESSTRSARRLEQWNDAVLSVEDARHDIEKRDARDSSRETSPLRAAADAVMVSTDNLSPNEVVEQIAQLIQQKL
jgi:cytidylate kinase